METLATLTLQKYYWYPEKLDETPYPGNEKERSTNWTWVESVNLSWQALGSNFAKFVDVRFIVTRSQIHHLIT